jgi:hypothetical protein
MILSSENICDDDIENAHALFLKFCEGVENLYGIEFCSFNCHQLLHAAECVRNWGPLWAYLAFQFEGYNGTLLNLFNGSQKIETEIANRLNSMSSSIQFARSLKKTPAVDYFLNLFSNKRTRKNVEICTDILFFGNSKIYYFLFFGC